MTGRDMPTSGPRQRPLVSVIMNCFNGEKYLREALESVLSQTYENWEIIFWDNQSADQSAAIFRNYGDPRLRYFHAPTHTFLYEARNYAVQKSKGDLIAFLDVDDWWHPEKLAKQVSLFDDPTVGFACSNYWVVREKQGTCRPSRKRAFPTGWVLNDLLMEHPIGMLTLIFRRIAFESLPFGFDPRFHVIGDTDLEVRLAMRWEMACCQELLAYYRIHGENGGQKYKERHVAEFNTWVDELGQIADVAALPGYKQITQELAYMQGLLGIDQNIDGEAGRCLGELAFGKYKLKLWARMTFPGFLRLIGDGPQ